MEVVVSANVRCAKRAAAAQGVPARARRRLAG
jgi:hypothetical protein